MQITEQMIRELQERVNVTYEEAEKLLRRAGGNIDVAEHHARRKENSFFSRLFHEFEKVINLAIKYRLQIGKEDDIYISAPLITLIVVWLVIGVNKTLLLAAIFVVWALVIDCKVEIHKVEKEGNFSFYRTVEKDKEVVKEKYNRQQAESDFTFENNAIKADSEENFVSHDNNGPDMSDEVEIPYEEGEYLHEDDDDDYYEVTIDK